MPLLLRAAFALVCATAMLGAATIWIEDLPNGGSDWDFNDVLVDTTGLSFNFRSMFQFGHYPMGWTAENDPLQDGFVFDSAVATGSTLTAVITKNNYYSDPVYLFSEGAHWELPSSGLFTLTTTPGQVFLFGIHTTSGWWFLSDPSQIGDGQYHFAVSVQDLPGLAAQVQDVPEPASWLLVSAGLAWVGLKRHRG